MGTKIRTYSEICKFFKDYFAFSFFFVLLQSHLPVDGVFTRRDACEVEHYILEGVISLCFWLFELPQSKAEQEHCRGDCHGVYYILLRSVLRRCIVPSQAHFTGVLYTPSWVFLCLFFSMAVVGQNNEQADVSTHVFFCSHR